MKKVLSAGGIIFREFNNQKQILLVIKQDGLLTFPKGHVESGESLEAAAIREVEEETGLQDIQIGKKLGVVVRPSIENSGEEVMKEIHLFEMTSATYTHRDAEEKYGWFSIPDALSQLKFEEEKQFLEKISANEG